MILRYEYSNIIHEPNTIKANHDVNSFQNYKIFDNSKRETYLKIMFFTENKYFFK